MRGILPSRNIFRYTILVNSDGRQSAVASTTSSANCSSACITAKIHPGVMKFSCLSMACFPASSKHSHERYCGGDGGGGGKYDGVMKVVDMW